jgi:RNA polymerase sigma-70 factor (ECF subfamily)
VQSDAELVETVLSGDRASFGILVQRYERAVLGVALGILGDYHAAQDVAQDALVTAHRKLKTLRNPERFASWLLGIARRRAIDVGRGRARRRQEDVPLDAIAVDADGQLDDMAQEVFEAVSRLPERQRQLIMHRYCDGLTVQQIAEATGSPVGTVTKYLSRAHARLRKLLLKESNP